MTSSYSVGSILGLVDKFNLINPDIVIAGSGSAGTASYYVSGQYDSIRNIWENLLSTKKFINFFRINKIIDIDYLIDEVFKNQDILNHNNIKNSKIDYYISVTNVKTADVDFLSTEENIFEKMRATKAMPIVYGKKINIDGKKYCDTFLSSAGIDFKIKKAVELGAKKIIILNTSTYSKLAHVIFNFWAKTRCKLFYFNYMSQSEFNYLVPRDIKIFEIKPKGKLKLSVLNNSKKYLKNLIDIGYKDVLEDKELEIFLK